jgi:hypothetical protein
MSDERREGIQKALGLIREAVAILETAQAAEQDDFDGLSEDLQDGEEGERAEEVVEYLEEAVIGCDEAISACESAAQK